MAGMRSDLASPSETRTLVVLLLRWEMAGSWTVPKETFLRISKSLVFRTLQDKVVTGR